MGPSVKGLHNIGIQHYISLVNTFLYVLRRTINYCCPYDSFHRYRSVLAGKSIAVGNRRFCFVIDVLGVQPLALFAYRTGSRDSGLYLFLDHLCTPPGPRCVSVFSKVFSTCTSLWCEICLSPGPYRVFRQLSIGACGLVEFSLPSLTCTIADNEHSPQSRKTSSRD